MGLASSQARLLNLTSRMHQIEYKAAKLEAMKLQMANESKKVYEDYLDALEKTKVQVKTLTNDGAVTYEDIASYTAFLSAGYAIDFNGEVYDGVSKKLFGNNGVYYASASEVPSGVTATEVTLNWNQLCKVAFGATDTSTLNVETVITNLINTGMVTLVQGEKLIGGGYTFRKESDKDFADFETSISTNTGLQEISDEIELKKAEAKYEADMKRIDMKDRRYDSELAAIETERNAIKQEMETLKTVSKDNVERTFKLFS